MMIPFVDFVPVNYPHFIAAMAAYILIGQLWYSDFLFGKKWHKLAKVKPVKMTYQIGIGLIIMSALPVSILTAFIKHMGTESLYDALLIAACGWLGFIVPAKISSILYTKKTSEQFSIEILGSLAAYLATAAVIAYFIFLV